MISKIHKKIKKKNQSLRTKWKALGKNHLIDTWKIYFNDKITNAHKFNDFRQVDINFL